ncbi:xylulokinase [Diaminobutyricimonas aerilata]|uniref:Xylulose kinase n=1 Tax=Diaminobutyricimonas aerilata TaxID=1162967 RepID=A0A2M9CGR4_9MICO|nr:xylulokinase [Diaminobutyricimonas aerilata]PJJ71077.1 xylulokinase [Diaminobutyricimonas aerilata]
MTLVAGVDSSTQSCKVVVRDLETGAIVRTGRASHPTGTEVDPQAWWDALLAAVHDAGGLDDVAAVSVAGQQHGMVVLDAQGRVIRPALLWNDTRSAGAASDLIAEVGAEEYARRTGVVPVASFTATKLRWLADAEPENAARVAAVALPHDWLTWRLRGFGPERPDLAELVTDRSDASGTAYFDGERGEYDRDLLARALRRDDAAGDVGNSGVALPAVLAPGDSRPVAHGTPDFPTHLVVGVGAGDNAGAALGLGAATGDVVVSIGTSGTVFAVTDTPARDASGTVAGFADAAGGYLPLIATLNAARILDSVSALLGVDHVELGRLALDAEPGSAGLVLQPYFEGERTPNLPDATATLFGMTLASTTRENLARAAIEGLLCGLADGLDAVRGQGVVAQRILLVGGAAQNEAVARIAAQVFDVPVVVPEPAEYVALGAAAQAAWALSGSRPEWHVQVSAEPAPDHRPVIREQYAAHRAA